MSEKGKLFRIVSKHNIIRKTAPLKWQDGFPLGNGDMGVMMWGNGNPLAFTLDKSDLWDLRCNTEHMKHPDFNYAGLQRLVAEQRFSEVDEIFEKRQRRNNPIGPTKISIGRAELGIGGATQYNCALNLSTATVEGTIQTAAGRHRVQCFVLRNQNVFCLRVTSLPSDIKMQSVPLAKMNASLAKLNHPKPHLKKDGEQRILIQHITDQLFYAVVWNQSGPDFFLTVETAESAEEAVARAKSTWKKVVAKGFDCLHREHLKAWDTFWSGAEICLPEQRIEFLWYYGLYLLASSSRPETLPPGLQGLWAMDGVLPPWWGDYHADINVQETFWPACASGHLELLDSWCNYMKDCIKPAQKFTHHFFGTKGTFWICTSFPRYTICPCWHTVQFAWSNSGWLGWLVWLRWRYSMDVAWLAETGYPIITEIFRFFQANLKEEEDGYLHIPLSNSPEYQGNTPTAWCKDPNIDIALIRRCCDWVIEMGKALGIVHLSQAAQEVHRKLVPYHLTEKKELCLWANKPLDESHRHPSHLMAIHPAMDLTIEDDEETRRIIETSLEQYLALGQYLWAGHTYAQMVSFAAVVGRQEFAYDCLLHFITYWVGPNGLYFNRDTRNTGTTAYHGQDLKFTMEANCAVSAGISDMLVQGWNNVMRIFPAVPAHWLDIAFRDLLTEGAFRVSAIRRDGRTVWVKIVAGIARKLRLRNPFGDAPVKIVGAKKVQEGNMFVADLKKGQEIVIHII